MHIVHQLASVPTESLDECVGYDVESRDGRVGVVEDVWLTPDGHVDALVVRHGLFRPTTLLVPVADVVRVRADRRSVVVRRAVIV